ncbi:FecCD family ABC transporter permease [Phaeobacter porticola]|uniref:ABC-type Fe3+-siderophore transport system, permease component n=1 Tax=Phaeobacter porticola TaxID=1844006 RepID=A0A1L3IAF5_9RHOB|nr:iron ABC transporter permease [Phaeobacter porticola]APG49076.1 ABC-type Fe3+-siderophore transport system, permease component [Phaeobacter porticola]
MTLATDGMLAPATVLDRRIKARRLTGLLVLVLAATALMSLGWGASGTSLWAAIHDLMAGRTLSRLDQIVLFDIRLPRMIMGVLVGSALAISGTVMQGLFRNPLADPGIVGVSAGAGLAAISAIVLGAMLPPAIQQATSSYLVSISAFIGSWLTILLLYRVSTRSGQTSVATMLLAGIALGALAGAAAGLLIYIADDNQLRDLTFWGMGSLAGATWSKVLAATPVICLGLVVTPFLARGLNGLALGEAAAEHTGIPVQRVKNTAIFAVSAATGAAVAVSGGIGFVGIVVPHLLRLATGPDHHSLLPNSALLGASLLLAADMISRTIISPAELPIGIVTAVLGAPVFLWILLRRFGGSTL